MITEVSCQSNKFTEVPNLLIHLASSQSSKLCVSCNLKKKKKKSFENYETTYIIIWITNSTSHPDLHKYIYISQNNNSTASHFVKNPNIH